MTVMGPPLPPQLPQLPPLRTRAAPLFARGRPWAAVAGARPGAVVVAAADPPAADPVGVVFERMGVEGDVGWMCRVGRVGFFRWGRGGEHARPRQRPDQRKRDPALGKARDRGSRMTIWDDGDARPARPPGAAAATRGAEKARGQWRGREGGEGGKSKSKRTPVNACKHRPRTSRAANADAAEVLTSKGRPLFFPTSMALSSASIGALLQRPAFWRGVDVGSLPPPPPRAPARSLNLDARGHSGLGYYDGDGRDQTDYRGQFLFLVRMGAPGAGVRSARM
jgi:hypothetical protein